MYRNLVVLFFAQAFAMSAAPIVVLLGGIIGIGLAPSVGLATLPYTLMIIGTAVSTIPAAMFMEKFSRKLGFMLATFCCALAGLGAAWGVYTSNFWVFCISVGLVGVHNAFVQQYRFAVVESVPSNRLGFSLSVLMLSGVIAAYLGPEAAKRLQDVAPSGTYVGSFLGLSILMLIAFAILGFYRNTQAEPGTAPTASRKPGEIIRQPVFILAVGAGMAGYGVMSLIMTATPISMHAHHHISMAETTLVIQSHIIAMYLPSLFSGYIIHRIGSIVTIWIGLLLLCACIAIGLYDQQVLHYWWALVLLGIGWNLLFLGGTSLLTKSYEPQERFKAQAINDFAIFSSQAIGALGSGILLSFLGWNWLLALSTVWILALFPVIFWATKPGVPGLGRAIKQNS